MSYSWPEENQLTVKKEVGIGTDDPQQALDVRGAIAATEEVKAKDFIICLPEGEASLRQRLQEQEETISNLRDLVNSQRQQLELLGSIGLINTILQELLEKEGDSYLGKIQFASAIASYEKAIELGSSSAKAKLDKIKYIFEKNANIDLGDGITMEFVFILGGQFLMGGKKHNNENPIHEVTIQPFWMGKTLVTQKQWQAIMGKNPSRFRDDLNPVENVTWDQCKTFCSEVIRKTKKPVRLPSEAEWEYACRAGKQTEYSFGDDDSGLREYAWYSNNSGGKTHPVGKKEPNPWGLLDMHGNVWEWCEDDWHDNYEGAPNDGRSWLEEDKTEKVLRGGSCANNAKFCRSAFRNRSNRNEPDQNNGFRVAFSLPLEDLASSSGKISE